MLEITRNILSQKNIASNKNNNFFNIICESDSIDSVFNKVNQYLLNKEIEFDNVLTEEKKDNNKIIDTDKSIICSNFVISNLLNILSKKNTTLNADNINKIKDNIQKKKDKSIDFLFKTIDVLKNKKILHKNKNNEKFQKLKIEPLLNQLVKNKKNEFYQINDIKIVDFKKIKNQNFQKKISFLENKINSANFEKHNKKISFLKDIKSYKSSLFFSKNINKINSINQEKNLLIDMKEKEHIKLNVEPLILNNSENSIEWKKLISQKILLSIFNKKNEVEINLKPEYLGHINITIHMKDNEARLNFISNRNEVRKFLDSYIPFLRNSLIKNGIKLEEFNIFSSFKNKELKNSNNLFYKNIFDLNQYKTKFNIPKQELDMIKYNPIDVYV